MSFSATDGLCHLVAELEHRLTGGASSPRLDPELGRLIPQTSSYLLILFDGLGDRQLAHPAATALAGSRRARLQAPFPTTTTVSLATVATGRSVASHGWLGHLMWLPELGQVVNTLKWVDLGGHPVVYPTGNLLPAPNLWERLSAAGIGAVTVQPAEFADSPLTAALYRGCRFVGYHHHEEFVGRCQEEAARPGQLIFAYWPPVDFAAHVFGMESPEYHGAIAEADRVWSDLHRLVPPEVALVGTADHGMVAVTAERKRLIRDPAYRMLDFFGDPRAVMVRGSERLIRRLVADLEVGSLQGEELQSLWSGDEPHPDFEKRTPAAVLLAPDSSVLLPPGFDKRLQGYHGGLTTDEVDIPFLVRD